MLSIRQRLIGWLCIIRLSVNRGEIISVPPYVRTEIQRLGWCSLAVDPEDGLLTIRFTELGKRICDLESPQWGIDPLTEAEVQASNEEDDEEDDDLELS